jgi:hypothetical protein
MVVGVRKFFTLNCRALPVLLEEKVMISVQTRLEDELRSCAVELRQLAYTLQNGVGEHDLLRLSERMRAAADEVVGDGA